MQNIALFCASGNGIDPAYFDEADSLGSWIGSQGKRLIYGGSNVGLMEATAQAVKRHGGFVTGIITTSLCLRGKASSCTDEQVVVETLSERKQMMMNRADVFVALPGGIGTIDEMFDVLASAQLGYHDHPLIICNIRGFYDDLLRQIASLYDSHFIPLRSKGSYEVVSSAAECIAVLQNLENKLKK